MKIKHILTSIASILSLSSCIGINTPEEPPVTNVIVEKASCNNGDQFLNSKCYGAGISSSPFIMPYTSKDGIVNPVTGKIILTYKNMGTSTVQIQSALLPDSINYRIIQNDCTTLTSGVNSPHNYCDILVGVNTSVKGNINMQLPMMTYTDSIESYPLQRQFLFNGRNVAYVTVSDAGNVVNGYLGTGNNINGTVGLTSNAMLSFTTNIENASNLNIDITPLTSLIGATPYTLICKNVENTGQVCQYNIQYKPTSVINNQTVTLPYTYNNNVGAYSTGNLQVLVNVGN